jgi:hypothetical protein
LVGRSARRCRFDAFEAEIGQIKRVDKAINHTNGIALLDPLIKTLRQQRRLSAIGTLNEALHESLYYAGKIASDVGGFIELNYDGVAQKAALNNVHIRYVREGQMLGQDVCREYAAAAPHHVGHLDVSRSSARRCCRWCNRRGNAELWLASDFCRRWSCDRVPDPGGVLRHTRIACDVGSPRADRCKGRTVRIGAAQFAEGRFASVLCLWLGAFSVILPSFFLPSFFLLNWIPSVLIGSGFSPERAAFGGVLLNLGGLVGALIISIAVRRAGPYWPVIVALCFGGVLVWLVGQRAGAQQGMLPLVFLAGVGVFGAQLAMPALAAGLFPLAVRGAGVGWAMGIGRVASIVAPVIGGALIAAQVPWTTLLLIVAVPVFFAALAIFLADRVRPCVVSVQAPCLLPASVQPRRIK